MNGQNWEIAFFEYLEDWGKWYLGSYVWKYLRCWKSENKLYGTQRLVWSICQHLEGLWYKLVCKVIHIEPSLQLLVLWGWKARKCSRSWSWLWSLYNNFNCDDDGYDDDDDDDDDDDRIMHCFPSLHYSQDSLSLSLSLSSLDWTSVTSSSSWSPWPQWWEPGWWWWWSTPFSYF